MLPASAAAAGVTNVYEFQQLFHRLMQQAVTARPKGIKQFYVPDH